MSPSRRPLPPEFAAPLTPVNRPVRRCPVPRERASRRVLVMRLGAHGDILMGTPLLAALRDAWPEAHLTWLVERGARESIDANPYVDELLLWSSSYWRKVLRQGRRMFAPLWAWRARDLRRELKARRYDAFVSFQPEEWPLLTSDIGASHTIGVFDTYRLFYRATRTSPHTRLYDTAYTASDLPPHRTDQYLLPLRALGLPQPTDKRMQIGYTAADDAQADGFLREHGTNLPVILAPLTTWPSRCWPAERYVELGDALARQGHRVFLIGSAKERPQVEGVAARMTSPPVVAAGALGFRALAALIARAALVISGDTGPMHVAAAVGTPYVALFGPTPIHELAPLAGGGVLLQHPVPCGPCSQKICPNRGEDFMLCQRLITVPEALEAAARLLCSAPPAPNPLLSQAR